MSRRPPRSTLFPYRPLFRSIPAGYKVTVRDTPADGVEHLVLTRANPSMLVNVARITAGAPVSLRAVLSNDTVAGDAPRDRKSTRLNSIHHIISYPVFPLNTK